MKMPHCIQRNISNPTVRTELDFKSAQFDAKAGVYHIPCKRGSVYVGETGWNFSIRRLEEHIRRIARRSSQKNLLWLSIKDSRVKDSLLRGHKEQRPPQIIK
jgi:hypothetical protein